MEGRNLNFLLVKDKWGDLIYLTDNKIYSSQAQCPLHVLINSS